MFTFLLGLAALLVAGCAAYFSVLGIATLFIGSYYQVMVMAGSLEFGKLVATSYLYRYWNKTTFVLKMYLIIAVLTLMGITSLGIFGYLSAAYQVNSNKNEQIEQQIVIIEQQKQNFKNEIDQVQTRIETLNKSRIEQEKRLPNLSSKSAKPIYEDIQRAGDEIKNLNVRTQQLNNSLIEKDNEVIALKTEAGKAKDIGTFKFIAQSFNMSLDTIVKIFILIIVLVFDPLAVSLVLAFNVATKGKIVKEPNITPKPQLIEELKEIEQSVATVESVAAEPVATEPVVPIETTSTIDQDIVENLKKEVKTFLGKAR
jgi:hypothetical protein